VALDAAGCQVANAALSRRHPTLALIGPTEPTVFAHCPDVESAKLS
jgi:hypothetical protein